MILVHYLKSAFWSHCVYHLSLVICDSVYLVHFSIWPILVVVLVCFCLYRIVLYILYFQILFLFFQIVLSFSQRPQLFCLVFDMTSGHMMF